MSLSSLHLIVDNDDGADGILNHVLGVCLGSVENIEISGMKINSNLIMVGCMPCKFREETFFLIRRFWIGY